MLNTRVFFLIYFSASFLSAKGIFEAIEGYQPQVVIELIEENPKIISEKNPDGITPLFIAVRKGMSDIVKILLEHGADPDMENDRGGNPLRYVQTADIARLLLEHGANPNKRNIGNSTPLHFHSFYTRNESLEIVKLLLANGANPNIRNEDGYLPEQGASEPMKQIFKEFAKFNVRVETYETRIRNFFPKSEYYKKKIAEGTAEEVTVPLFPNEIWDLIAKYLPYKDQSNLAMLSKQFRQGLMPRILGGLPVYIIVNKLTESEREMVPLYTWQDLPNLPKLPKIEKEI